MIGTVKTIPLRLSLFPEHISCAPVFSVGDGTEDSLRIEVSYTETQLSDEDIQSTYQKTDINTLLTRIKKGKADWIANAAALAQANPQNQTANLDCSVAL